LHDKIIPAYVSIVRIQGPFLFGTTEKLDATVADIECLEPIVILRLRDMPALDATGVYALETFTGRVLHSGRRLLLCGATGQPLRILTGSTFLRHLGAENLLPNIESALHRAEHLRAAALIAATAR
jgi:SulP family sulfate permease